MTEKEFTETLAQLTTKAEKLAFIESTDKMIKTFRDFADANVAKMESELAPKLALLDAWKAEAARLQDLRDLITEAEWETSTDAQ